MEKNDCSLIKDEILSKKEFENCRCLELEERSLKAEVRCVKLESDIQKRNEEFEALESKFKQLESEKNSMENELKSLKQSKPNMDNVVDLTGVEEEEDPLVLLGMENRALEYEKKVAETEGKIWKSKFEKLLILIRKLNEVGTLGDGEWKSELGLAEIEFSKISGGTENEFSAWPQSSGSPYIVTPGKDDALGKSRRPVFQCAKSSNGQAKKCLLFEDGDENVGRLRSQDRKVASTAAIDLCDSDEETGNAAICDSAGNRFKRDSGNKQSGSSNSLKERNTGENYEDEDVDVCEDKTATVTVCKRKRVISSDSESDVADDIPICKLKRLNPLNQENKTPDENMLGRDSARQRPLLSRQCKQRVNEERSVSSGLNKTERLKGIQTTDDIEDDESEGSESESLNGFIVNDSDGDSAVDGSDESTRDETDVQGESESDERIDYADVMSRLRRAKNPRNSTWEFEGDMLADFGKDPELCMRAVCVLYRNQTADEKASKSSHYYNQRGFSKFDAVKGTLLGEFLTDGDPNGDLKKTVEDLRQFDSDAIEHCRVLATRYSKQLFQIYKSKEDPFFAPP